MRRVVVIMAGGSGQRFWPLSRADRPKQLLRLAGNRTMLEASVERAATVASLADTLIITNARLKPAIEAEAPGLPADNVIAEPDGRNTAACLALAVSLIEARHPEDPDTVMVVMTADHHIGDTAVFDRDVATAADHAERTGDLVTFGIVPSRAETGYGYIEQGDEIAPGVRKVVEFHEKPDAATAARFVSGGRHLWNSGMFVWRTSSLRAAMEEHLPGSGLCMDTMRDSLRIGDAATAANAFAELPCISIDNGVMEKAAHVAVVRASFDWDDIGSWASVSRLREPDSDGNSIEGEALLLGSRNTIVYQSPGGEGTKPRLIVGMGLDNLVIVDTPDAVLVVPHDQVQRVKDIVAKLQAAGRDDLT